MKWGNGRGRLKYGPMTGGFRDGASYGAPISMNPYWAKPYGPTGTSNVFGKPFGFGRGIGFGCGHGRGSTRGRGYFVNGL
jgi:hypothetical protein